MSDVLKFSTEEIKNRARSIMTKNIEPNNIISIEDTFFLLISGIGQKDLNILCSEVAKKYNINNAYDLIMNYGDLSIEEKREIFNIALDIVLGGKTLGSYVIPNTNINTSDWLNHSLFVAKFCYELAAILGLDADFAFKYGLLHDYGRKFSHTFDHVVKGFEELNRINLGDLSKGTLTHSFINGGRYCCNEVAPDDLKINENGKEEYANKDELAIILDESKYTMYDYILNIADLVATSKGIDTPKNRIDDIATRRNNIDASKNRIYFYSSFIRLLDITIKAINMSVNGIVNIDFRNLKSDINLENLSLEEIKILFAKKSEEFAKLYKEVIEIKGKDWTPIPSSAKKK